MYRIQARVNREFKLHVLTANVRMNKSIRNMENNLLTHTKHETTHFDVLSDKRQTVKVYFLPFAGKINVKLNLSIVVRE